MLRPCILSLVACVLTSGGAAPAAAQASIWDSTLTNTHWYVPVPQLLAYAAPKTGFSNPLPIGDQTLWTLGVASNGAFTGTSTAKLAIGPAVVTDNSTIQGMVTPAGQITMIFTPTAGGTATVGLGQMRLVNGVTEMEMQMITGDSLLVSHWAYMLPYDPASFTPPPPQPYQANSVPQWAWMSGTPWRIVSPAMFGTTSAGRFVVTNYQNGYFWGTGIAPNGSSTGTFTLLGSVTPEGKVLFNTLSRGQLTSLYGTATGDASGAQMAVSTYDLTGNPSGGLAYLSLIQPYPAVLAAAHNRAGLGAADVLFRLAATPASVTGQLASTFAALDSLGPSGLSTAISQTLPVLTGAAAQATYVTQRDVQRAVADRLDDVVTLGAAAAERQLWLKPLGGTAQQGGADGALGYRASGGGVVAGIDRSVSQRAMLGGMLAYTHQVITGSDDAIPNRLGLDSYRLGLYGAYAPRPDTIADVQLDGGINATGETRSISFIGSTASASYRGTIGHAGLGLKQLIPLGAGLTLAPTLRLDYGEVRADAYRETGASGLNLNVESQIYRELTVQTGLKSYYRIARNVSLVAEAGVGYNTIKQGLQITAAFAGGGDSFVTRGIDVSPWLYSGGLGFTANPSDKFDLSVRYGVQATTSGYLQQSGSLLLKLKI